MILVVDNYDSFTWNLVQLVASAGVEVDVVRNDAASVDELLARRPDGILISPGPGRPEEAGVCLPLLARRQTLQRLLEARPQEHLRFSAAFEADAASILASSRQMGLEGVMAKRKDAPYESRRTETWLREQSLL